MLLRTHLAIAILGILILSPFISDKIIFVGMAVFGTILVDLDSPSSLFGKIIIFRPFQLFLRHRGIMHSILFGVLLSLVFAMFYPVLAFGFFTGFALHLVVDSFTREGVKPFWPFKTRTRGFITTGGMVESILFLSIIAIDIIVFIVLFVIHT